MKRELVPIAEVGEHSDVVTYLGLDLPNVDMNDVGLDIDRLHKAMHWGGIGRLAIGSYDGDTTQVEPSAMRFNPDGTISATGQRVVSKAKMADLTSKDDADSRIYDWRNNAIYINNSELKEQLDGAESETEIVKRVDKSIRSELRHDVLFRELYVTKLISEAATLGVICVWTHATSGVGVAETTVAAKAVTLPTYFLADRIGLYKGQKHKASLLIDKNIAPKYSIMSDWRIDRAALAMRHLARPIIRTIE